MKGDNVAIGRRVRAAIDLAFEGELTQAEVAERVSMTPDALSRALRGERGLASVELVELAELTGSDLHELITGEPDPARIRFVARHDYEPGTGRRGVPGREQDEEILRDLALVYRQGGTLPSTPQLPTTVNATRDALGGGFARPFADRLEQGLGIDVVRLRELSTCYSFSVAGRLVVAVGAVGNWFRENFGIAHELGHIVHRHHDEAGAPARHEREANAFAAELLLPGVEIRRQDWTTIDDEGLASFIWSAGVSTQALRTRLDALRLPRAALLDDWAEQSTQKLLRRHLKSATLGHDEITERMTEAAARRFPLALREAHLRRIAAGEIGKGSVAWMLGVAPDDLEVEMPPDPSEADPDELGELLGLTS